MDCTSFNTTELFKNSMDLASLLEILCQRLDGIIHMFDNDIRYDLEKGNNIIKVIVGTENLSESLRYKDAQDLRTAVAYIKEIRRYFWEMKESFVTVGITVFRERWCDPIYCMAMNREIKNWMTTVDKLNHNLDVI